MPSAITEIPGIKVGHAQDLEAITGCTVILCEGGAVGGMDQRGGAPGTHETDLLDPVNRAEVVHAVLLSGGSAFGLAAVSGVMRYLEERNVGVFVRVAKVPIVPAAILFDLAIGRADIRPDAAMGYQACGNASTDPPAEGSVGAGTGATVGKLLGIEQATKGGIGTASIEIGEGVRVGAIVAVNPVGHVADPATGQVIAGVRRADGRGFADAYEIMRGRVTRSLLDLPPEGNTVIGVVATNAKFTKPETSKLAQMAQSGVARCVHPAHTMLDGDTLFALSTGEIKADVNIVGAFAAKAVEQAILRAVREATSLGGVPAARDLV